MRAFVAFVLLVLVAGVFAIGLGLLDSNDDRIRAATPPIDHDGVVDIYEDGTGFEVEAGRQTPGEAKGRPVGTVDDIATDIAARTADDTADNKAFDTGANKDAGTAAPTDVSPAPAPAPGTRRAAP